MHKSHVHRNVEGDFVLNMAELKSMTCRRMLRTQKERCVFASARNSIDGVSPVRGLLGKINLWCYGNGYLDLFPKKEEVVSYFIYLKFFIQFVFKILPYKRTFYHMCRMSQFGL